MEDTKPKKRLIPVRMNYNSKDNTWNFKPTEEGYSSYTFKASDDEVRKLLRKMRAKDSMTTPNSRKKRTYRMMIDKMKDSSYQTIYAWGKKIPKTIEDATRLMKE